MIITHQRAGGTHCGRYPAKRVPPAPARPPGGCPGTPRSRAVATALVEGVVQPWVGGGGGDGLAATASWGPHPGVEV